MASDDKLITLTVDNELGQDLRRFRSCCQGVVIHVASGERSKVFSPKDVKENGFEVKRGTEKHPDFVETFWKELVDEKLDIEIDGSVDTYVRRPPSDIVLFVKP